MNAHQIQAGRAVRGLLAACLAAVTLACESGQSTPLGPSPAVRSAAAPDTLRTTAVDPGLPQGDPTLKVTAPDLVAPADGAIVTEPVLTLATSGTQALFVEAAPAVRTEIEIWVTPYTPGARAAYGVVLAQGRTHTLRADVLQDETGYLWRARTVAGDAAGPWSALRAFRTDFPRVGVPELRSPRDGATVASRRPAFTVGNPPASRSTGTVVVELQLAADRRFARVIRAISADADGDGATELRPASDLAPDAQYFWRARGKTAKVTGEWSAAWRFRTPAPTPDPAPPAAPDPPAPPPPAGGRPGTSPNAPFTTRGGNPPNMLHVVRQVAARYPGALRNSCQDHGGSWEFMERVVETLRAIDGRWAYNCKRGNCNTVSHDVVDYYRGSARNTAAANRSTDVAIIDIIAGHCGGNPRPAWIDQTRATADAGSIGRWKYPR